MSETALLGRIEDLDVAVAHWHIKSWGGAEHLVTKLAETVGSETVFTTGDPEPDDPNPYGGVEFYDVIQDQAYAPVKRLQQRADRVFEYALWEDVDWREYGSPDVLVTSGATPRAVITPDDTLHVNYCHSPPRWFYDLYHDRKSSWTGVLARPLVRYLRMRDQTVDSRVDRYFANSPVVARRIQKYYRRDSETLYPPVDIDEYGDLGDEGFYLHLGRLDEEKGVDAMVEAFVGSDHRLVLAGSEGDIGEDAMERIRRADEIDFRGFVDESEKRRLLGSCRALVFNARNEDFGIVPVEANASGKAVLTRNEGFPGLFVSDGENGFLHDGTPEGIQRAIEKFERERITGDPREQVETFSTTAFHSQLESSIVRWRDEIRVMTEPHDD